MPFLDELASGIAPVSTPDIAASLGLPGGVTAGAVIVAFHSLALFVEAPLLAWSERVPARWFSAGALAVVALSAFWAAAFPRSWMLAAALAVYGPASGCALAVAEGLLVESNPGARERMMARLSLAANAGDLVVPVLLAVLAWFGFGWRAAYVITGVFALWLAVAHARSRPLDGVLPPRADDQGEPAPALREALRVALSTPALLGWSSACALTNLLDEVLVAFSAVHLRALGATPGERSSAIALWVLGGFLGVFAVERLAAHVSSRRLLLVAAASTLLEIIGLATTHSPRRAMGALFLIGVTGSALHPLAKARAYAALPNRPAIVNAVASALLLFDIAAPVALGVIAMKAGSEWAIAALVVAPVGVAIVSAWEMRLGLPELG